MWFQSFERNQEINLKKCNFATIYWELVGRLVAMKMIQMSLGHWWNMPLQALNISTKLKAQTIWQRHAKNDQVFQPPRFAGVMMWQYLCKSHLPQKQEYQFLNHIGDAGYQFQSHFFQMNLYTSIFPPPKRNTCWLPPFCRTKKCWRRSSFDIGTAEWHQDDPRASLYLTSFSVQSTNGVDPESTMASWMDNAETFPPPKKLNEGWICREDPIPKYRVYGIQGMYREYPIQVVVASNIFYFHPYVGGIFTPQIGEEEPTHCDEHIFQRGWFNRQLVNNFGTWECMVEPSSENSRGWFSEDPFLKLQGSMHHLFSIFLAIVSENNVPLFAAEVPEGWSPFT